MANEFNEDLDIDVQFNSDLANARALALSNNIRNIDKAVNKLNDSIKKISSNLNQLEKLQFEEGSKITGKNVLAYSNEYQKLAKVYEDTQKIIAKAQGDAGILGALKEQARVQGQISRQAIDERALSRELRNLEIAKLRAKTKTNQELLKSQKYTKALVAYEQSRKNLQDQRNQALIDAGLREPAKPKISGDISNLRSAYKDVNEQVRNINKNTKTTNKEVSNWAKRMTRVVASFLSIRTITRVISQVVKESGSWIENLNLFAVTFGESNYREMLDWATELADKLGLSNNEIVKMTGYFKQLSSAIGIAGEQGTELSQILTQLGYDFASFYNIDTASAFEKLQSGIFSGQIRTLRSLGIDVSQAAIQNLLDMNDAFAGLNAQATDLTQMQKVLARTILTMQAGVNAFGDMARSIDTLQNRQRILTASLENLRLAFGDLLAEPAREFLAYGIAITQSITQIIRAIVPLQTELSYDIGDTVFTEITDEAEEAESAINQLSFDKFNALTTGDEEQVSLTEALNNLLQEQIALYEQVSSQFDGIDERVQEIRDSILSWALPNTTIEEITNLVNGLSTSERFAIVFQNLNPVLQTVVNTFKSLWTILTQIFNIVSRISPIVLDFVKIILDVVNGIVNLLDQLGLLEGAIVALFALKVTSKINNVIKGLSSMSQGLKTASINAAILIGSFTIMDGLFSGLNSTGKLIMGMLVTLAATFAGVAVAAMAADAAISWGTAIPIILAAAGAGIAGIKAMIDSATPVNGYATGGIPDKSELFYMNEHGIPEALINTGGTETNVINQQQLKSLVRDGFIEAMLVNGNQQVNVTISGNDINNSAFARAIFPALKAESRRRGGSQL